MPSKLYTSRPGALEVFTWDGANFEEMKLWWEGLKAGNTLSDNLNGTITAFRDPEMIPANSAPIQVGWSLTTSMYIMPTLDHMVELGPGPNYAYVITES